MDILQAVVVVYLIIATIVMFSKVIRDCWREYCNYPRWRLLELPFLVPLLLLPEACVLLLYALAGFIAVSIVAVPLLGLVDGNANAIFGVLIRLVVVAYAAFVALGMLKLYWDDALFNRGGGVNAHQTSYSSEPATTAHNDVIIPTQYEMPSYGGGSGGSSSAATYGGFGSTYGPSPGHPSGDQATTNYN